jgi:flagellar hook-length control protein FliK
MTNAVTGSTFRQMAYRDVAPGKSGSVSSTSFGDLLNKQTAAVSTKEETTKSDVPDQQDRINTGSRAEGEHTEAVRGTDTKKTESAAEAPSIEEEVPEVQETEVQETEVPDEVLELMNSLAAAMMEQTAGELGLTEEELNQLLTDLNMEVTDLLKADNLLTIVVAAGGESDAMSLLTKEDLYGNFQQLTGVLTNKLDEAAKTLGMTTDELSQLMEQATQRMTEGQSAAIPETSADDQPVQIGEGLNLLQTDTEAVSDATSLAQVDEHEASATELSELEVSELETPESEIPKSEVPEAEIPESEVPEHEADSVNTDDATRSVEQSTETIQSSESNTKGDNTDQSRNNDSDRQSSQSPLMNGHTDMLRAQAAVTQAQSASPLVSQEVDTESIIRQIVDYMEVNSQGDTPSLEMQLTPEHLGTLRIHLAAKDGVVSAQIVAQNETVKNALESQMIRLVESFDEQGIKVDSVEVSVGTNASPDSFDQNTGSESGSGMTDGRSGYGRRLRNLNLSDLTQGQELDEEDRLAAEMLRAGGNTIDYAV